MLSLESISPLWFRYTDTLFILLAFLATFTVTLYSYRIYRLTELRNAKYLTIAFFMVSLGLLAQGMVDFSTWYDPSHLWVTEWFGSFSATVLYQGMFVMALSFTLFGFLVLTGLFLSSDIKSIILMGALFSVTILSALYYRYAIYHGVLTTVIFVLTLHYYERSKRERKKYTFFAFLLILSGYVLFTFVLVHPVFYVLSHSLRIAGFGMLVYNLYSVYRK